MHKDIIHMGFPFKWIIPNIPCIMIKKNNIVLKPSIEETGEVHTSEKRSSSGWDEVKVEEENGIL